MQPNPVRGSRHTRIQGVSQRFCDGFQSSHYPHRIQESVLCTLISGTGARPLLLTPEQHDATVAAISHLPFCLRQRWCG